MTWLTDLIKHLSLSKSFTGALFITSLAILAGPELSPELFDPVPAYWRWLVVASCIFSFTLLAFWAAPPVFLGVVSVPNRVRNNPRVNPPTKVENAFLYYMGENYPNGICNIDAIDHSNISKLELLQLCKSLNRKGMISINTYDDDIVSLTERGREYALQLTRQEQT